MGYAQIPNIRVWGTTLDLCMTESYVYIIGVGPYLARIQPNFFLVEYSWSLTCNTWKKL